MLLSNKKYNAIMLELKRMSTMLEQIKNVVDTIETQNYGLKAFIEAMSAIKGSNENVHNTAKQEACVRVAHAVRQGLI